MTCKCNKKNILSTLIILFIISSNLIAATLSNTDNFTNGSLDGWQGDGYIYNDGWMYINRDKTAYKTYDFGVENANKEILVTFYFYATEEWDSSGDRFRVYRNNLQIKAYKSTGGYKTESFSTTLDSSGKIKLSFKPDTNRDNEWAAVDYVNIQKYVDYSINKTRSFTLFKQDNIRGNIKMIGNSVLKKSSGCANSTTQNNDILAEYADMDSDDSTYNSTSADLVLPKGIKSDDIVYALLYWQGRVDSNYDAGINGRNIKLKLHGSSNYKIITSEDDKFNYRNGDYQGFSDITDDLKNSINYVDDDLIDSSGYNQPVWVADVYTDTGYNKYGAWSLIVTYKDKNDDLRNITLYDGYDEIYNETKSYELKDFLTPTRGNIDAKFMVFAGEGDVVYGDSISLTDKDGNDVLLDNDFFHSSEDIDGVNITNRNPNCPNTIGIDLRTVSIGKNAIIPVISNGQTQTTVKLSSSGDQYFPGVFVFSTQLYEPRVCYYIDTIVDDGNTTIFKDKGFLNPIQTDKNYKFNIWISNMKKNASDTDIETAKLVQVYMDLTDMNYTSNSTYIQNIGESNKTYKTDNNDSDTFEFSLDKNESTFRVGTGANGSQGGTIEPASNFNDDSKKVFISFQSKFDIQDSNTSDIDLLDFLGFKASFQTDSITIGPDNAQEIEQCVDLNTSGLRYTPVIGYFNATHEQTITHDPIDTTYAINALYTQVANKDFNVTVVSLGSDKETPNNYEGYTKIEYVNLQKNSSELYSCEEAPAVSNLIDSNATFDNQSQTTATLKINKAVQNGTIRINYIDWENLFNNSTLTCADVSNMNSNLKGIPQCLNDENKINTLFPANNCLSSSTGAPCKSNNHGYGIGKYNHEFGCAQCLLENNSTSICARDSFAIRPDKFDFSIQGTSPFKSGKNYNISIAALDNQNLATQDYNETINDSFKVDINETKPNCLTGVFTPDFNTTWNFSDGNSTVLRNYNEVGVINVKVQEINGSEFAVVDKNDTSDAQRLITPADINLTFSPDHFDINTTLVQGGNNFTYISDDLNMSTTLDIKITAKNEVNATTQNYNSNCYAMPTNYTISYANISTSNLSKVLYRETNTSTEGNVSINSDLNLSNIPNTIFSTDDNGSGNIHVDINFDRNKTKTVNPFILNIQNINTTDSNGTFGTQNLDKNATFYYGRVHTNKQTFEGTSGVAPIYYEVYCNDCNKTQFNINGNESVDSVDWFVNTLHVDQDGNVSLYDSLGNTRFNNTSYASASNIIVNQANILNGVENITLSIDKAPYNDRILMTPSSWLLYNTFDNNASTNDFEVEFIPIGGNWSGYGDEMNGTVDTTLSKETTTEYER
ncbi:hypothetical protein ACKGJI_06885 [Sulfurospirillum sp. 1307]